MPLSSELIERIQGRDPELTEIHLSSQYPALNDEDIELLVHTILSSENANIKILRLYDNDFGDKAAELLSTLTSVTTLDVSNNDLSAIGAQHLAKMFGLTSLAVSGNKIADKGFTALLQHPTLNSLDAYSIGITNIGAKDVLKNTKISVLLIEGNNISPILAAQINEHIEKNIHRLQTAFGDNDTLSDEDILLVQLVATHTQKMHPSQREQFKAQIITAMSAIEEGSMPIPNQLVK